ncbi:MAG: TerC family protein [Bacteroidia bacterium]|jgi:predicted tellurium resistance membrane protein TerC
MEFDISSATLLGLFTLTLLEVILGIDNVIFISILAGKLPKEHQKRTRRNGLMIGMVVRIIMLLGISVILALKEPLVDLFGESFSGKDLVLLIGGIFLIFQSVREIHHKMEIKEEDRFGEKTKAVGQVMLQLLLLNFVFSIDSVITAVGMVKELWVMITAVLLSMLVMLLAAGPIAGFVEKHPSVKILALSFLILIGVSLIAESMHAHLDKGYIYSSMAFAFGVELINLRTTRSKTH